MIILTPVTTTKPNQRVLNLIVEFNTGTPLITGE